MKLKSETGDTAKVLKEKFLIKKGILNIQGQENRFVFQGVHMLFDGKPDRQWRVDEQRKNELVFIGRDLDEARLRSDFTKCLATGIGFGEK